MEHFCSSVPVSCLPENAGSSVDVFYYPFLAPVSTVAPPFEVLLLFVVGSDSSLIFLLVLPLRNFFSRCSLFLTLDFFFDSPHLPLLSSFDVFFFPRRFAIGHFRTNWLTLSLGKISDTWVGLLMTPFDHSLVEVLLLLLFFPMNIFLVVFSLHPAWSFMRLFFL